MYELRPPAPALRRSIEHYWSVTPAPGEGVDLRVDVFVDARADLIINHGTSYTRAVLGERPRRVARSNLDAQRLRPLRIVQRGDVRIFGVRFHLGGLAPFAAGPLHRWTDQTPAPAAVFGEGARALDDALRGVTSPDAMAAVFDAFFLAAWRDGEGRELCGRALDALVAGNGAATVAELAAAHGLSARSLERLFARHVGLSPKTVARVLRFQAALRALMSDPGTALADVAAACGYFDQAHFVRDFRRFTGGVPRGYRGYYPKDGPRDFAPNVVAFVQDPPRASR